MNDHAVQDLFIKHHKTLALAESCTGGLIAATLTKISGSSAYFLGSIVPYSNTLKVNLLKVKESTLEKKGAVSKEVAEEMVLGLFQIIDSDYALAVTGVAGPGGGTPEKPVGTVWCAIANKKGRVESFLLQLTGTREDIQQQTKDISLERLLTFVKSDQ